MNYVLSEWTLGVGLEEWKSLKEKKTKNKQTKIKSRKRKQKNKNPNKTSGLDSFHLLRMEEYQGKIARLLKGQYKIIQLKKKKVVCSTAAY